MADPGTFLIYGANGFTGRLVAREAKRKGLRPVLAGRSAAPIQALAAEWDLPWRVFDRKQIGDIITLADQHGLQLLAPEAWSLECGDRCVAWGGSEYTFICLAFRKHVPSAA